MHLNSQKRLYLENAIYFVTTKTRGDYPYFREPILAKLFIQRLGIAKQDKRFRLYGYVIMPDHVHLLLRPSSKYNLSDIMFTVKKQFAHEANRLIGVNPRIMTPDNVGEQALVRLRRYVISHTLYCPKFQWQKSFHDHIIRDERDLFNHMEYIKINPIKHGLVKEGETCPFVYINFAQE